MVNKMRLGVAAALVALSSHQAGLVSADDALNIAVVEAVGEYFIGALHHTLNFLLIPLTGVEGID